MTRNILIAFAIASTAVAQTEIKPYVSLGGGGAFMTADFRDGNDSNQEGGVIEGAVGLVFDNHDMGDNLRTELALSFQRNDYNDPDVGTSAIMVNGYWDICTGTALTPYILVGIGRAHVDIDFDGNDDDSDNVFAYQLGGGVGYSLTENVILDLKYKYFATEDVVMKDDSKARFGTHQILFGVRYQF